MGENAVVDHKKMTLFEWMKSCGFPDSTIAVIATIIISVLALPFIGGETIWALGSNPLSIPGLSDPIFWISVSTSPFMISLLFWRIFYVSSAVVARWFLVNLILSFIYVFSWSLFPGFAVNVVNQNFDQTFHLGFQDVGHSWYIAHETIPVDRYCHFKTKPLLLDVPTDTGCALRLNKIEVDAGGRSYLSRISDTQAAFDLEVFVATESSPTPTKEECLPAKDWALVKMRPKDPDVHAHTPIFVAKPGGATNYSAYFDFGTRQITAFPSKGPTGKIVASELSVANSPPFLQLSAWTLWGDHASFQVDELTVRAKGQLHCGFSWIQNIISFSSSSI